MAALLGSVALLMGATSSASAVPAIGVISSQHYYGSEPDWEAVEKSGATMYRMEFSMGAFSGGASWAETYDLHVEKAAKHGITILAYLNGGEQGRQFPLSHQWSGWLNNFVWQAVTRYGENGTFWAAHPGLPYRPITVWEVWNEPNLPENNPGGAVVQPRAYGELLEAASSYIHGAANARQAVNSAKVLFGGLWQNGGASGVAQYMQEATGGSSLKNFYDGLSLHPYSLSGTEAAKLQGMKNAVTAARSALTTHGGAGKSLWITELGWPVAGSGYPSVSEAEQASLLTNSFNWLQAESGGLGLQLITWYLYRDAPGGVNWDAFCGLRNVTGSYRPAWWAFQTEAGAAPWPGPPTTTGPATGVQAQGATLNGTVNPVGYSTSFRFEYGTDTDYDRSVPIPDGSAGAGLNEVAASTTVSGLRPGTTYHYRLVATHVGGTTYGADQSFTTSGYRYMSGLSSGSGISSWQTALTMSLGPREVGDFNGDSRADVISIEPEGGSNYRYKVGFSNGTAIPSWSQVMSGMSMPAKMDVGDFNADGKADIIAAEAEGGSYSFRVGFSSGGGISSWSKVMSGMGQPTAFEVADFNADGKADIIAVEPQGNGKYRYMLGVSSGAGVSSWSSVLTEMSRPARTDLGDFTGDGKADIVSTELESGSSYRYKLGISSGSGVSAWNTVMSAMSYAETMDVADFNADGKADLMSAEVEGGGSYRYKIGFSSGSGVSSWETVQSWMRDPQRLDLGDFNADGKADIVAVEPEGGGKYRFAVGFSAGGDRISGWNAVMSGMGLPSRFRVADFNADGKADIIAAEAEGGSYSYRVGFSSGSGISSWSKVLGGMSQPVGMRAADFNADGKADIVALESEGGGKYRYQVGFSNGTGISAWSKVLGGMGLPVALDVADFNADGKADIIAAEAEGGSYSFRVGFSSGGGISSWSKVLGGMSQPTTLAVGDVSGDAKADIISSEAF